MGISITAEDRAAFARAMGLDPRKNIPVGEIAKWKMGGGTASILPSEQMKQEISQLIAPTHYRMTDGVQVPYAGNRMLSQPGARLENFIAPNETVIHPGTLAKMYPRQPSRVPFGPGDQSYEISLNLLKEGDPAIGRGIGSNFLREEDLVIPERTPSYYRVEGGPRKGLYQGGGRSGLNYFEPIKPAEEGILTGGMMGSSDRYGTGGRMMGRQPEMEIQAKLSQLREAYRENADPGVQGALTAQGSQVNQQLLDYQTRNLMDANSRQIRTRSLARGNQIFPRLEEGVSLSESPGFYESVVERTRNDAGYQTKNKSRLEALRDSWKAASEEQRPAIAQEGRALSDRIKSFEEGKIDDLMSRDSAHHAGTQTTWDMRTTLPQQEAYGPNYPISYKPAGKYSRPYRTGESIDSILGQVSRAEKAGPWIREIGSSSMKVDPAEEVSFRGLGERDSLVSDQNAMIDRAARNMSAGEIFDMQAGKLAVPNLGDAMHSEVNAGYSMTPSRLLPSNPMNRYKVTERVAVGSENIATPSSLEYNRANAELSRSAALDSAGRQLFIKEFDRASGRYDEALKQIASNYDFSAQPLPVVGGAKVSLSSGKTMTVGGQYLGPHAEKTSGGAFKGNKESLQGAEIMAADALDEMIENASQFHQGRPLSPVGILPEADPTAGKGKRLADLVAQKNLREQERRLTEMRRQPLVDAVSRGKKISSRQRSDIVTNPVQVGFTPTEELMADPRVEALRQKVDAINQAGGERKIREMMQQPTGNPAAILNQRAAAAAEREASLKSRALELLKRKGLGHLAR